ncbi:MAG: hypothetical protein O9280_13070 [Silanimonas sp.]|nr:hypothetical protein [Silanimonas sp.]
MVRKPQSKDTRLYIWKADEVRFSGQYLYKIGLTKNDRGWERVAEVSEGAGLRAVLLLEALTDSASARQLERAALKFGRPADVGRVGGSTEFRWLTDIEYQAIESIVTSHNSPKKILRPNEVFNDYERDANDLRADASRSLDSRPHLFSGLKFHLAFFLLFVLALGEPFGLGVIPGGHMFTALGVAGVVALISCAAMNNSEHKRLSNEATSLMDRANTLVEQHKQRAADLCANGRSTKKFFFRSRSSLFAVMQEIEREQS